MFSATWCCHPSCPRTGATSPQQTAWRRWRRLWVKLLHVCIPLKPDEEAWARRCSCDNGFLACAPASPEPGQMLELMQELAKWKQELGGGTEAMDPIHYDKVLCLQAWGGGTASHGMPMSPRSSLQDSDLHLSFITAASNLRAENYGIPPASRLTVSANPDGPPPHRAAGDTPLVLRASALLGAFCPLSSPPQQPWLPWRAWRFTSWCGDAGTSNATATATCSCLYACCSASSPRQPSHTG